MRLLDVNVLIFRVNVDAPQHDAALAAFNDSYRLGKVALPWAVLTGFLRIATHPGIMARPLTVIQALDNMNRWLEHEDTVVLEATPRHASIVGRLLLGAGVAGNLVSDAHLAAMAIEHDAEMLSFDKDFGRFTGLRWTQLA